VRDVIGDGVALQALGAAFAAVAAFLDAAERRFGDRCDEVIDREVANLDLVRQTISIDVISIVILKEYIDIGHGRPACLNRWRLHLLLFN
jgi:hypothetical protein